MPPFRDVPSAILGRIIAVLFMGTLVAGPAPAYIMGRDDRAAVDAQDLALPAVRQTGIVHIEAEDFVTGLLTGANCDVVISAGHAAYYDSNNEWKGWKKGERRAHGMLGFALDPDAPSIPMQLMESGYDTPSAVGRDDTDWAVFRLSRPALPACTEIPVGLSTLQCERRAYLPAYHFDRRDTRLIDRACSAEASTQPGVIVHDCDTKEGSSGAPLMCRVEGGPVLIGINVSGLARERYYDPGVYGQTGEEFDMTWHKNYAVAVHGDFYRALQSELRASRERAASVQPPAP